MTSTRVYRASGEPVRERVGVRGEDGTVEHGSAAYYVHTAGEVVRMLSAAGFARRRAARQRRAVPARLVADDRGRGLTQRQPAAQQRCAAGALRVPEALVALGQARAAPRTRARARSGGAGSTGRPCGRPSSCRRATGGRRRRARRTSRSARTGRAPQAGAAADLGRDRGEHERVAAAGLQHAVQPQAGDAGAVGVEARLGVEHGGEAPAAMRRSPPARPNRGSASSSRRASAASVSTSRNSAARASSRSATGGQPPTGKTSEAVHFRPTLSGFIR